MAIDSLQNFSSSFVFELDQKWNDLFYCTSVSMLATLIQRYNFYPVQERETNWNFTGCQLPHFMIVLIPYINLLNLYSIIKCLFLRNMEPLIDIKLICQNYRTSTISSEVVQYLTFQLFSVLWVCSLLPRVVLFRLYLSSLQLVLVPCGGR